MRMLSTILPTRPLLALTLALATWFTACNPVSQHERGAGQPARVEIELHLLVVDDPGLAAEINRLRADWKARSGASIVLRETAADTLVADESLSAAGPVDAVIYPSRQLGTLVERGWIAPLPGGFADNSELAWRDVFELLQLVETSWAQTPYAVTFGSPVFTCLYRADLLEKLDRRPPNTWKEYHELASLLAKRESLGADAPAADAAWHASLEPLAPGWAGLMLLARAAAYARHRDHFSTLFNIETMEPLIAGQAFVRALDEMVADAKPSAGKSLGLDPAAVRREFFAGHAPLAISWPTRAEPDVAVDGAGAKVGFVELPGSPQAYNVANRAWETRPNQESPHVPLIGVSGRVGSIARASDHAEQTLALLAWLSGREWSNTISPASPATTLFRKSQVRTAQAWIERGLDTAAAEQYATSVRDALSRDMSLRALGIPGEEKYLAALDTAVAAAVRGERSPAEALAEAANQWREITTALSVESQRSAYRKSIGLQP
jgi:multiple sugar transport system substrate-binding protein